MLMRQGGWAALVSRPSLPPAPSAFVEADGAAAAKDVMGANTYYLSSVKMPVPSWSPSEERLFDFEDLSSEDEDSAPDSGWDVGQELLWLLQGSDEAHKLKELVELMKARVSSRRLAPREVAEWLSSVLSTSRVAVRTAAGSSDARNYLTSLRHEYVVLLPKVPGSSSEEVVIEPYFSECFELGRATDRYTAFSAHIPSVYVGTRRALASVVRLAAQEINLACQCLDQAIPPWRKRASLLSRWNLDIDTGGSSSLDDLPVSSFACHKAAADALPRRIIRGFEPATVSHGQWPAGMFAAAAAAPGARLPAAPNAVPTLSSANTDLDTLLGQIKKVRMKTGGGQP